MKKQFILFLSSLILLSSLAYAGTTTVTGTVQDPSGQTFNFGTVEAQFVPNPLATGVPNVNGAAVNPTDVKAVLSSTGTFSIVLTDNTTVSPAGSSWNFVVCPQATFPCTTVVGFQVNGPSIDLSSAINAQVKQISIFATQQPPYKSAYSDTEVIGQNGAIYFNLTTHTLRVNDNGTWVSTFSGVQGCAPVLSAVNSCGKDSMGNQMCATNYVSDSNNQLHITQCFSPTTGEIQIPPNVCVLNQNGQAVNCPSVVQGTLSFLPTSLNFGNVNQNQPSQTQTITFTNTSSSGATINLSGAVFNSTGTNPGTNFSLSNNCSTLAPGASCPISVTAIPTTLGALSDTITVTDDASNSPQTITVFVIGVTPSTPTPASVTVTPVNPSITAGTQQPFVCTVIMSDSSVDGAAGCGWNSSNPAVASVDPVGGVATGLTAGTSTIAANAGNVVQTVGSPITGPGNIISGALFPKPLTVGNTLACLISTQEAAATLNSVTDLAGNTFTIPAAAHIVGATFQQWVAYAQPVGAFTGEQVTAHFSVSVAQPAINCMEVQGAAGGLDTGTATASASSTAITTPITTANPSDFIFTGTTTGAGSAGSASILGSIWSKTITQLSSINLPAHTSTAGDTLVCHAYSTLTNAITFSDTNGDTWTDVGRQTFSPNGESDWQYATVKTTGSNTITVASSGTNVKIGASCREVVGLASTSVLDQHKAANASGATTAMSTGNFTTTATDVIFAGFVDVNAGGTFTAGSGYTNDFNDTAAAASVEEQLNASAGTFAGTATDTISSATWIADAVAFKVAATGTAQATSGTGGVISTIITGYGGSIGWLDTFATGTFNPGFNLNPSGAAIISAVPFKTIVGSTTLTVTGGVTAAFSLSNPFPAGQTIYPLSPANIGIPSGTIFTRQIPSSATTFPLQHCWGNTSNCSDGDTKAKFMFTGGFNCNIADPTSSTLGCGLTIVPKAGAASGSYPLFYSNGTTDKYATNGTACNFTTPGENFIVQFPANAAYSGNTGDNNISIYDQAQNLTISSYGFGKGANFAFANCAGHTGSKADPCVMNSISACASARFGTDPDWNGSQTYAVTTPGNYTLGRGGNLGQAPLAQTVRITELIAGNINHSLSITVPCVNNSIFAFPGPGSATLLVCNGSNGLPVTTSDPIQGGLYWCDYTDAQINAMGLGAWHAALLKACAHYGAYVNVTSGGQAFTGFGLNTVEGNYAYGQAGFASSPANPLCSQTDWAVCTTGSPANAIMEGDIFNASIPLTVTSGSTSVDSSNRACGSGGGCDWTGHVHLLDQCVAKTMANQPGGC